MSDPKTLVERLDSWLVGEYDTDRIVEEFRNDLEELRAVRVALGACEGETATEAMQRVYGAMTGSQLDQYRASVIPMFVDNGEVTTCTSMSGGKQEHEGMPKELTLMRTLGGDAKGVRMAQYRHTGLIEGVVDFYAECAEGVTESGKPE